MKQAHMKLSDAKDILDTYHRSISGKPDPKSAKKRKSTASLRDSAAEPSPVPTRKKRKEEPYESADDDLPEDEKDWTPNTVNWDSQIQTIETVERDELGNLSALIRFTNGRRVKIGMNMVYKHCPIPMLKFYENHL